MPSYREVRELNSGSIKTAVEALSTVAPSTSGATEAKQDTLIAKDFATQTTLAAILAKIIAAPATEAKQDTLIAKDFATQTTLAAILAKIIAAPATEGKQDTQIATLGATSGAAVKTDAAGTLQQYLRGLVTLQAADGIKIGTIPALAAGTNEIGSVAQKISVLSYNRAVAAPGANTDILASDITPTVDGATIRVAVTLAVSSVFNLITNDGSDEYTVGLNSSNPLNAGDRYEFEFTGHTSDDLNFQVETNGIIQELIVTQIA